ncbi:MAG: DUF401 family protein [Pseudoflavonifractor sp.]|nr:DUF401 family protein [Pseudoflavonifractor sp.]
MIQLFAVVAAILCIPLLTKMKISVGPTLIILGVFAGVLGRLPLSAIGQAFWNVFAVPSTLSSVLAVIEIGMLSTLMDHYGLLKRMELAMRRLLPNPRLIMMLMPALVGALQAPGGAALSASFTNHLGSEIGLTPAQRADVNVICRHVLMLIAPFSVNMVIVKSLAPNVDVIRLGLLNLGTVILMQVATYFVLLRKSHPLETAPQEEGSHGKALVELLLTLSPIFAVILLNTMLNVPFPAALLVSILLVFLIGDRKDFPQWLVRSFNPSLATMIIGVYFFQNIVSSMSELLSLFTNLVSGQSDLVFLAAVAGVGLLFGFATGLMYLPMGILIPIVATAPYASEMEMLIHLSYAFLWCFVGYVFSPLHLCQLLSDKETGATVGERYRTYLPLLPVLPVLTVFFYFFYQLILL